MVGASEIIFINKWEREIGYISNDELLSYNLLIKELKEVALKDFQFKIINKILVTKSFLHRIRKIDENQCSYYATHQRLLCICLQNVKKSPGFGNF